MKNIFKLLIINLIVCAGYIPTIAQPLSKVWEKRFGGAGFDDMHSMVATADGGFLLGGTSDSGADGDRSQASQGGTDYWVVKIDGSGNKVWDKRFGGSEYEIMSCMIATADGNFLLGGHSGSDANGDKSEASQGSSDYWIVKIDGSGNKLWDKRFGGTNSDEMSSMLATADGGFLLAGYSYSGLGGDKSEASQGGADYWVVKIDASGNKAWDKRFGGTSFDFGLCLIPTSDGGFLLGGYSESGVSGDKSQTSQGGADFWVVKINGSGTKVWDKRFGGNGNEYLYSMVATSDDSFLLGGPSSSGATGDKSQASQGNTDCWVIKIDGDGNKVWDKRFGGTSDDIMYSMINTSDGGFLLGASSYSDANGDKSEDSQGAGDYWSVKIDENGTKVWDKRFGGTADDIMYSIIATADGGFLLGGYSFSNADGDKSQNSQGQFDYWVVKMGNACTPPTASISTSAAIICNGTSTMINFTGTPGAVVTYYSVPNGIDNQTVTLSLLDGTASISTGNLIANEIYYLVSAANPDNPTCWQALTGNTQVMVRGVPYATISGNTTICSGTSTNITFGGLGNSIISYQLNGGSNQTITLSNPGSPDWTNSISTGNLTETATYIVISAELPGNPSCLTTITGQSATVNISGSPTISLSNSQACAGQAVTLTATAGFDSYSWSSSGGSFTSTTNEATFSSVASGGYSFTVTVTRTSGCSATATASMTVNASTAVSVAGSTLIACSGQEVNLTATGGFSSYSWGSSGGTFTSTTNQATFNSLTAGTYQFTVTVTAPGGCIGTATSSVFVRAVPSATISNNSIICTGTGNTIIFSSTSGDEISGVFVNYRVNGQVFSANIVNGTASVETGNLTTTTTYELFRVGYSASVTCPTPITGQSATVTVRPNPTATISGNTSVCVGGSTNLTITATPETRVNYTVNGGAWQQIDIGSTGVGTLSTGNLTATAIYNLIRVGYAASVTCPVTITGQSATVAATPPTATLVGATQYCTGETINLSVVASCGTPSSYSWSGPNGFSSRASAISIENARTTRSGTYQVQVVFASSTISLSVVVTVSPLPDIKVQSNPPICAGQNIALTFTKIPLGSTAVWQGPMGFNSNSIAPVIESATTANEGTYSVTVTEGSCTVSATTFVKVNPTLSVSVASNSPVCEGGTIRLSAISSATTGFSWRGPRAFLAASQNPTITNARTYNSGIYSVTLTAAGFCVATATAQVIVVPIPVVTITTSSGKTVLCTGSSLQLSASATDPSAIQWFRNNVSIPAAIGQTIAITSSGGTYRAEITNTAGCTGSNTLSITTTAPPAVTATNTVTGTTIKLTATPTGLRYSWSGPVAFTSTVRNPSITNATVANAGIYTIQGLMVSTGCTATATTSVVIGSPTNRLAANAMEQEPTDWLIKTYPNPTNHILIVEVVLPEASAVQFLLLDITGREQATWRRDEVTTNHRLEIDMSAYDEGLWLLQAQHKTGSKTKKIWKIK